jgi:hypothetical protein
MEPRRLPIAAAVLRMAAAVIALGPPAAADPSVGSNLLHGSLIKTFPLRGGLFPWVRRSFTLATGTATSGTLCLISMSRYGNCIDAVMLQQ